MIWRFSPPVISVGLHVVLLALLSLVVIRHLPSLVMPPAGMEIEIADLEQAMPLPDPVSIAPKPAEALPQSDPHSVSAPAAASLSSTEASMRQAAPGLASQPLPVFSTPPSDPSTVDADVERQLAPAPVAPSQAVRSLPATPPAGAAAMTQAPTKPAVSVQAPEVRLDPGNLARSLATQAGAVPRQRLNAAAIGSAIGRAAPKGAGSLSIRQRAELERMIRSQITPCWNPPEAEAGFAHLTVLIHIRLDRQGTLASPPSVVRVTGQTAANAAYANALAGSVRRAVQRCMPLRLPSELYDAWADVELNFDPRDVS